MSRLLVLADTHIRDAARIPPAVLSAAALVDRVIHCGDIVSPTVIDALRAVKPVDFVAGNCDPEYDFPGAPARLMLNLDGVRIGVTHGDGCAGDPQRLLPIFHPTPVDLVLFGHTHRKADAMLGNVRFINPGSATKPRDSGPTVAIVEVRGGWIYSEFLDI